MSPPENTPATDAASAAGRIVAELAELDPRPGLGHVVCVDGPAGSGKTTLAGLLADLTSAADPATIVFHMDDAYEGWTGIDLAPEARIIDQVLRPLSHNLPARWQQYDWDRAAFGPWHDLAPDPGGRRLLVLEGCASGALEYDPYRTRLVWVEAGADERVRRGIERDGEQMRSLWMAWMDSEQRHFERNRTRERADVTVRTD